MRPSAHKLSRQYYRNRNGLERRAGIGVNAVRIDRVNAATGHLPEPFVVDAAARLPVIGPAEENTGAVNAAATAVCAMACNSLRG